MGDSEKPTKADSASPIQSSIISDHLREPKFQKTFKERWASSSPCKTENFELIAEPFRVCRIFNFLKDEEFLQDLKKQIKGMTFERTTMDLYQFEQTLDFVSVKEGCVKALRDTFLTEMKDWMQSHTGIELNDTLSMSSSMYLKGDYLLCHDDNNEDRRIAFILYLNEYWSEENGGDLALLGTDEYKQPRDVVKRVTPKYNCLLFFEVTQVSYHQVLEMLSTEKFRWSINGWFHGPLPTDLPGKPLRPDPVFNFESVWLDYTFIDFWVNKDFLTRSTGVQINKDFEKNCITLIGNFFKSEEYSALNDNIRDENIEWIKVGPPDVRNYEVANIDTLPNVLRNFVNFLRSREFLTLMSWFTDSDIVPEEDASKRPSISIEIQRWSRGSYLLIDPDEAEKHTMDSLVSHDNTSIEDYLETPQASSDDEGDDDDDNDEDDGNENDDDDEEDAFDVESRSNGFDDDANGTAKTRDYIPREKPMSGNEANGDGTSSSDDEDIDAVYIRKRKFNSKKSKRLIAEKRARMSYDVPSSSKDEDRQFIRELDEEYGEVDEEHNEFQEEEEIEEEIEEDVDTFKDTLVKSASVLEVERKVKIYETIVWMIENKKVVIPMKEDFKKAVKDRDDFYKFIENYKFDIEDTKRPRDSMGMHYNLDNIRDQNDMQEFEELVQCNSEIINRHLRDTKEKLEPVVNTILEIYGMIESGRLSPKSYKDSKYDILTEDPYEKIVAEEVRKTREGRRCIQIERLKLPRYGLEVIIPLNPLMNRQEEQVVYYVDPFVKDSKQAMLHCVPLKYNHVGVVHKQRHISRVHKYISHSASHVSYTIIVTVYRKRFNVMKIAEKLLKSAGSRDTDDEYNGYDNCASTIRK